MLLAAAQITAQAISHPTGEEQRIGVYILAGILGLLVCGLISLVKELREETASRP